MTLSAYVRAIPNGNGSGDDGIWRVTVERNGTVHTGRFELASKTARARFLGELVEQHVCTMADVLEMDQRILAAMEETLAEREQQAAYEAAEELGADAPAADDLAPVSAWRMMETYQHLRQPILHGLLRVGETMNIIASPKIGKSWLAIDLALAVASGSPWMGFEVEQGPVLIIDNELHQETITARVRQVAEHRGITEADAPVLHVLGLRGRLLDIYGIAKLLEKYPPESYKLALLDAFYRATPPGCDENSNSSIAQVYNRIDQIAMRQRCGFAAIHHATKGSQAAKAVTDVGAGAGSQARAVDTHLILRQHTEPGAYVLDAAVRSWKPIEPRVLRWQWPIWTPADDLDPAALKTDRQARAAENRDAADAQMYQAILDTFQHFPDGATKTEIRGRVGQGKAFERAWLKATNGGDLVECKVRSGRRMIDGFRRVYKSDR